MGTPIRPNVLSMVPYSPGKPIEEVKRELGLARVVKLASNENPLGPSPKAVEAMKAALKETNLYPDGSAFELKAAISRKFSIPTENIVVGNGSDELIHYLGEIFLDDEKDEVIGGSPSFVQYKAAANLAGCKMVSVPLDADLVHDLKAMAAAITPRTKLLFIANPNNPTGTIVRRAEFESFLRDVPDFVTVVLDEAYFEFAATDHDYPSSLQYILEGRNIIGLRTFSKAYGLAGIRCGYGFVPNQVADAINRVRQPFDVNSVAQAAGVAALDDTEHLQRCVKNNLEGLAAMERAFAAVGAKAYPSHGNFIFADIHRPARQVFEALLREGVIIRPGDIFGTPTCVRVTVGTPEENEIFAAALAKVMALPAVV